MVKKLPKVGEEEHKVDYKIKKLIKSCQKIGHENFPKYEKKSLKTIDNWLNIWLKQLKNTINWSKIPKKWIEHTSNLFHV